MIAAPRNCHLRLPRVGVRFPSWITFQRSVFDGIIEYMQACDPWIIDANMDSTNELEPVVIDENWRGDGLIVFRYTEQEAEAWKRAGIHVVNLSSECLAGPFPSVIPDNVQGGAEAARHLLTLGLTKFAFVGRRCPFADHGLTGSEVGRRYSSEREEGFRKVIASAGHQAHCIQLEAPGKKEPLWLELQELYRQVIQDLPRPCGVFAVDDVLAHGLLKAAHETSVRVPQDLALIGFNDQSYFCYAATPPLSSVTYPGVEIGRLAAETLSELMQGRALLSGQVKRVPVSSVTIRESTNVLAIRDSLVADAIRLIRKQAATSAPRVGEIAECLGVSKSLLRQRFVATIGRSPKDEIDRARVEIVRHWLATTNLGTDTIAAKTGFTDAAELRRFFRRDSGMTPQAFRQALFAAARKK